MVMAFTQILALVFRQIPVFAPASTQGFALLGKRCWRSGAMSGFEPTPFSVERASSVAGRSG